MSPEAAGTTPIRLVYPVTAKDQRDAVRAIVLRQAPVRWTRAVVALLPVAMVAWSISAGWPLGLALFRNMFWIVFASLYFLIGIPLIVRAGVLAVRKADPAWREEQVVSIDETGFRLASASAQLDIVWSEVRRAAESPAVFLVYFGAGRVFFIPSYVVSAHGMLPALRALLHDKLGVRANLR